MRAGRKYERGKQLSSVATLLKLSGKLAVLV